MSAPAPPEKGATPIPPKGLRDEFAMAALSGMTLLSRVQPSPFLIQEAAETAYRYADAMLQARRK